MQCCVLHTVLYLVIPLCLLIGQALSTTTSSYVGAAATPAFPPNATGTATVSAIPLAQTGTADYTSPWTISLSVFTEPQGVTTGLVLSWPDPQSNLPYGDVCAIWMPNLVPANYTGVDPSAAGSGNCSLLLGSACARDVGQAAFSWGLQNDCSLAVQFSLGFPVPDSCQSIHNGVASQNVRAFGLYNPTNNSAKGSYFEPSNSSNATAVFDGAVNRIWPVFILEEKNGPNNTTGSTGNLGCVQALNLTNAAASGGISSSTTSTSTSVATSTGTGSSTKTSAGTASPTATGKSGAAEHSSTYQIVGYLAILGTTIVLV